MKVCCAGWFAVMLGTAFLARLEISVWVKLVLLLAWWLEGGLSLGRFVRAQRDLRAIRMKAAGICEVIGPRRQVRPARCHAGTIVTPRWAWLRVADGNGRIYSELLLRGRVEATVWRRFQVLCQWGPIH